MQKMLIAIVLAGSLGAGVESAGPGEPWSDTKCWGLRTIMDGVKGNQDRQDRARRDYRNHCQGAN